MGKRTKQYKKLMRAFELLGFRQPYQLLMTSDVLLDTVKLDLITLFEKTLSTKGLKPMITQCCIVRFFFSSHYLTILFRTFFLSEGGNMG